jgi:hypothetical protein
MRPSNSNDPISASHQYAMRIARETNLKTLGPEGFFPLIQIDKDSGYYIPTDVEKVCIPH